MKIFSLFVALILSSTSAFTSAHNKLSDSEGGDTSKQELQKILFVDDSLMNRKAFSRVLKISLKKLGLEGQYLVETATNGQEAVNMADQTSYSLIVMDMQMLNMNGAEATYKIKQTSPKAIIIRFSTLTEGEVVDIAPEEAKETILQLFSAVLKKPTKQQAVQDVLKEFLLKQIE